MGYDEEQLVVIDINDGDVRSSFDAVKQAFASVPGVTNVSVSSRVPGDWKNIAQVDVTSPGREDLSTVNFIGVDEDFLETYDMELAAGRGFGSDFGTDSTSVMINETAARQLGLTVGDRLQIPDPQFEAEVVGIVRDFHFQSLHRPIGPMVLGFRSNPIDMIDYFTVRVEGAAIAPVVEGLAAIGARFDPDHPFEYNVLEQRLSDSYVRERRVSQIFGAAAALAVIVACLGLFGLAAYTARQRTKEIGIRKVLGATVSDLVTLLSRDFLRLVAIAIVISVPLAYFATSWWLEDFAYRTDLGASIFLLAGAVTLFLALATVSYHALRTAVANPVESLRYE
jgi:putative ABC transport system permease protein